MALWWEDFWSSRPEPDAEPAEGRPGLRRLAIVTGTVLALSLVPYFVPGLEALQVWVPGDPVPLARLVRFEAPAPAGGADRDMPPAEPVPVPQPTGEQARIELSRTLGPEYAANLGEEAGAGSGTAANPAPSGVSVSAEEVVGLVREVEDPSGRALDSFYAALLRTARGEPGALTRIAHFGDSTIAADDITYTVRRRMQARFGDGGHGFVLMAKGTMPYRHRDVVMVGDGWRVFQIIHGARKERRYGLGGAAFLSSGGAVTTVRTVDQGPVGTAASRFVLFYLAHPHGGRIEWTLDENPPEAFSTREPQAVERTRTIEAMDGPHRLKVRAIGPGEVEAYGVVLERNGPGVVYDSLGMVGARAARLLNADREHLAAQIRLRDPDLIILQFGGNEAGDRGMSMDWYERSLTEVVRHVRAGKPEAACLLMAPLDQGEVGRRGRVQTIPIVPRIVEVQRRVAAAEGCAFFDTFLAMGGEGAMGRWYRASPRLGWGDFRHATPAGYEVIGSLFYKALLKGFSDYVSRHPEGRPQAPGAAAPPPGSAPEPVEGEGKVPSVEAGTGTESESEF